MPVYATQADLNIDATRLIELTDSAAAPGVIDTVLLARLETEAESILNALIAGNVTLPFTTVPPIITFITAAIWARRLYRHREIMTLPSNLQDDYDMAMGLVDKINAGEIHFDLTTPVLISTPEVETSCPRGWTPRDLVQ